jgi:hypothetical protein
MRKCVPIGSDDLPILPKDTFKMMPLIRQAARSFEEASAFTDYIRACACLMAADNHGGAEVKAKGLRDGERLQRVIKAAVAGSITSNTGLTFYGPELSAFMSALRQVGAADAIFAQAMRLPLRPGRIALFSSIAAGAVTEGAAKPIRSLRLVSSDLTPQKAVATVVMSKELIEGLGDEAIRILGNELRGSVAQATDAGLITALTASSSVESSGGNSWSSMLAEIEELLHALDFGNASRPFLIVSQRAMKGLASAALANGVTTLGVQGGELAGVTILVTGAQAAGTATLIDASSLAVADEPIGVRASDQASFEMNDEPSHNATTPTATTMVSTWQTNCRALIAERNFAVKIVRPNSVASMTNVQWGVSGDSPSGGF